VPRVVEDHGGSLNCARRLFPNVPEPWIDLSTGINPHPYPVGDITGEHFSRLPEPEALRALTTAAATTYRVGTPNCIVAAPGTQILLPLVAGLRKAGKAVILGPTYAEHRLAAELAGHAVLETADPDALDGADLAVLVNPNNPDGRILSRATLHDAAARLAAHDGLLVVDEAFMDVGPEAESVARDVAGLPIVVLRSFGKFYGLAGIRLGFAIADAKTAALLRAQLGPWAVSGPALAIGARALADRAWRAGMQAQLAAEARALDAVFGHHGIETVDGTSLYRFLRSAAAPGIFDRLGRAGIFVRRFEDRPDALRIGLPATTEQLARIDAALGKIC